MATLLLERATKSRKEEGGSSKGKKHNIARFVVSQLCVVRDCHFGLTTKWSHLSSLQTESNSSNLLVWNFQVTKDKDKKEIMGQKAIVNLHKPD